MVLTNLSTRGLSSSGASLIVPINMNYSVDDVVYLRHGVGHVVKKL